MPYSSLLQQSHSCCKIRICSLCSISSVGVQQGSVLSPTFFLVIMDKLLLQLRESSAGLSIGGLYLGGASHADDVCAIASSASAVEEQCQFIQNFAIENSLKLNHEKTEYLNQSAQKTTNCRYSTSQLRRYLIQHAWATHGPTTYQQVLKQTSTKQGDNSLLLVPQEAFWVTQTHCQLKRCLKSA